MVVVATVVGTLQMDVDGQCIARQCKSLCEYFLWLAFAVFSRGMVPCAELSVAIIKILVWNTKVEFQLSCIGVV